ncbi:MAG: M20/M25/M40 family metallo-hydrolase [Prolixibacteraceae bacterium]|nr:M20/M25/M40 family metallo-hydrolase [Prolixibacteraceae bacterium]
MSEIAKSLIVKYCTAILIAGFTLLCLQARATNCSFNWYMEEHINFAHCQYHMRESVSLRQKARIRAVNDYIAHKIQRGEMENKKIEMSMEDPLSIPYFHAVNAPKAFYITIGGTVVDLELLMLITDALSNPDFKFLELNSDELYEQGIEDFREELHKRLKDDDFLGKGSLTVSQIFYSSPSRCAVADGCAISIDRRLTRGEDKDLALGQIRDLPSVKALADRVSVSMYSYDTPSWTGLVYPTDCYFPTWVLPGDHKVTQAAEDAYRSLFGKEPRTDKWTFSTNGVSIMGMFGIPVVGFGPGKEKEAHAPNEKTWKADLVACAALYAALPGVYARLNKG